MTGTNMLAWLKVILSLVVLVVVGFLIYRLWNLGKDAAAKAKAVANAAVEAITPTSENNIFYRADSAVTTNLTGQENSVGTWLAGLFYDDPVETMLHQKAVENPWPYIDSAGP
jgi:flagellar basal body-associated protein FliL